MKRSILERAAPPVGQEVRAVSGPGGGVEKKYGAQYFPVETIKLYSDLQWVGTAAADIIPFSSEQGTTIIYRIGVKPNESLTIDRAGGDRFRIAECNTPYKAAPHAVSRVVLNTLGGGAPASHTFTTSADAVEVWAYVSATISGVLPPASITVSGPALTALPAPVLAPNDPPQAASPRITNVGYKLDFTSITRNTAVVSPGARPDSPRLCSVLTTMTRYEPPRTTGWLYTVGASPQKFFYSGANAADMQELCSWDVATTGEASLNSASDYSTQVTASGDIVCVFRGEFFPGTDVAAGGRRPAIIYPNGDYANPVTVTIPDGINPTGWIGHGGVCELPDGTLLFGEYTRRVHANAYVWRVTKPYSTPGNWTKVLTQVVDRSGAVNFKHFHQVDYDPWSDLVVASSGDDNVGAKTYVSTDRGVTFTEKITGFEKYSRLLNMVFTPSAAYWATDTDSAGRHCLFRLSRGTDGTLDFTTHKIQELFKFVPRKAGSQSTYNIVLSREPHGLLLLDYYDTNVPIETEMHVYFWSFADEKMYVVATITGQNRFGFRLDSANAYPPIDGDYVVCGWNDVRYRNWINIFGNSYKSPGLNNLVLKLSKV